MQSCRRFGGTRSLHLQGLSLHKLGKDIDTFYTRLNIRLNEKKVSKEISY
jgi:hypothetical protein